MKLRGKYASAKVFTDNIEETAKAQIQELLDQPFVEGECIRIMPDVHAGKGCTIGTTMTLRNRKVVPNLVGVDIGCGMLFTRLPPRTLQLDLIDEVIREYVPSGFNIHDAFLADPDDIREHLRCGEHIDAERAARSIGTLGGGNHFIEIDVAQDGDMYLVVHSGSRHLGVEVAEYYQKAAYENLMVQRKTSRAEMIDFLKQIGAKDRISVALAEFDALFDFNKDLAYCDGCLFDDYIHDMKYVQSYASKNRREIARVILNSIFYGHPSHPYPILYKWDLGSILYNKKYANETVHNYIDTESMILRKGACRAAAGEQLIIPMNMRDGSLICRGKGNPDWNESAPHGAGRIMSRAQAKRTLNVEKFKDDMANVYSTSVSEDTLDECPDVYKPMPEIIDNIGDTVDVEKVLKPIYNFKAG